MRFDYTIDRLLHGILASDLTEDNDIRDRIAAQAVAAMDAAGHLARSIEARNYVTFGYLLTEKL